MPHSLDKHIELEKQYYGKRVHKIIRDVAEGLDKYGDSFFDGGE